MQSKLILILLVVVGLSGCAPTYSLVAPGSAVVASKGLMVEPASSWNKASKGSNKWEESWTKNGPLLDSISFVAGLPSGQALVKQHKKDDQQVPAFRSDMTPDELVSMIESYYRVTGISVFDVQAVAPTMFLGQKGLQLDLNFVSGDGVPRRGRWVMQVADERLYLMRLQAAASHYFAAVAPEFDAMVASATRR